MVLLLVDKFLVEISSGAHFITVERSLFSALMHSCLLAEPPYPPVIGFLLFLVVNRRFLESAVRRVLLEGRKAGDDEQQQYAWDGVQVEENQNTLSL